MINFDRGLTNEAIENCNRKIVLIKDEDWAVQLFEYLKKDEPHLIQRNYEKVIAEDELKLSANSLSGFGSRKIRNELPTWWAETTR